MLREADMIELSATAWKTLDRTSGDSSSRDETILAGATVLIVEDDLSISNSLAAVLEPAGYEPVQILDVEGLERSGDPNAPFLILDVTLRECDAVDIIQKLANWRFKGAIQIVSGNALELLEDIKKLGESRGLKMLPVMRKPVHPASLLTIVDHEISSLCGAVALSEPTPSFVSVGKAVDLGLALREGWVEVWYQPKYDVATLEMVGAECLSRVRHPERGVIAPGAFLPGASGKDLAALTDTVLRQACTDWLDFEAAGRPLRLAINVPGHQIVEMPLVKMLRELSPKSDQWPGLVLEVTEDEALRDIEAARAISTQLKIYGVSLSIDDFGMGYSSFSRLREIPFKEIKLDRSLVDGCAEDDVKGALCRSVIDLAHSFGAKAVAEGVECKKDLDFLRSIWCDLAQGYFCARPMPKEELLNLLR